MNLKVGDTVYCTKRRQQAVVVSVTDVQYKNFPVRIDFGRYSLCFTLTGKQLSSEDPCIKKLTKLERALK